MEALLCGGKVRVVAVAGVQRPSPTVPLSKQPRCLSVKDLRPARRVVVMQACSSCDLGG